MRVVMLIAAAWLAAAAAAVPVSASADTDAPQSAAPIRGVVLERSSDGSQVPVIGANIYWLGTRRGTTSDTSGVFTLPRATAGERLIISAVGYAPDTVIVGPQNVLRIILQAVAKEVPGVEVTGAHSSTTIDYLAPANTELMTNRELSKAACCNLSESFETNPSVDVNFTDAVTGTRQIEMLGLAGVYSQITLENLPAIRGLTSNVGLTFIPGPWISSIQVAKGVGSVANGYESITGQINVELRKPGADFEPRLFLNFFGNDEQRLEGNLILRQPIGSHVASMTMAHISGQRLAMDGNGDRFLDAPLSRTTNLLQRFGLTNIEGLEAQLLLHVVADEREGGTMQGVGLSGLALTTLPAEYGYRMNSRQISVSGKTGYVFAETPHRSIGLQWSWKTYGQGSRFGLREYQGSQRTGYVNLLYDEELNTRSDRIRFGASFLYDEFDERLVDLRLRRTERVPGLFAEYTIHPSEDFTAVAGLRADRNDLFGTSWAPRLHLRYQPDPDWVIRAVAGRGVRSANILAENVAVLASSRRILFPSAGEGPLFREEAAWNLGANLTHYFLWGYREATFTADFYRTVFERQVVIDLDRSPREVYFAELAGTSCSNSVQVMVNFQPIERLEARIAYRFLDVRQTTAGDLRERPFVAQHRAFVNLAYATARENEDDPSMSYDLTVQWMGRKRLPATGANPAEFRAREFSPAFALVNAQISRSFREGFDLYLGAENLLGFRQDRPVIDPQNPNGTYFDSSFIWGPVTGRMIYAGLRLGV